ncbi:MAG: glycosyltransferase family 87 protein [Proteobacteria bacterium]|nr:glycosyltransferase family 87 protein [Pseudomonadota bacterium]
MEPQKPYYPACVIAVLIVLSFGLVNVCQVYLLKDTYPVTKLWVGSDYVCVYNATQNLIRGVSLYENIWLSVPDYLKQLVVVFNVHKMSNDSWYCYPPILAYLNYPLIYFDMETASRLMFFILIAAVISAYSLINSSFQNMGGKDKKIIFLYGLIIILLSYPFYFLIVRGHMIGITILLLAAGIYLLKKNNLLCGICFGLSISMFLFPVLIIVPLFLFRRYKIMVYTLLTFFLLILLCPNLWWIFLKNTLLQRIATSDLLAENCSLSNTFSYFQTFFNRIIEIAGVQFRITHLNKTALASYSLLFSVMPLIDYKIRKKYGTLDMNIEIALILMYLPFMIAVPNIVIQYNLVILILLIPALCSLTQIFKKPMPQPVFWLFSVGIALSQTQAQSLQNLFQPKYALFHFFPAFGLFLVMIGCVLFKMWVLMAFQKTGNNIHALANTG